MTRQNPAVGDIRLWRPTRHRSDASVWCASLEQARIVYAYPTYGDAPMQVERWTESGWVDVPAAELTAFDPTPEAIREMYADILARSEFEEMHGGEVTSGDISLWPDCGMYSTYLRSGRRRADALEQVGLLPVFASWAVFGTEHGDQFVDDHEVYTRADAEEKQRRYYPHTGRVSVEFSTDWTPIEEVGR